MGGLLWCNAAMYFLDAEYKAINFFLPILVMIEATIYDELKESVAFSNCFVLFLFYFCFIFVFLNLEPSVVGLGCFFKLGS